MKILHIANSFDPAGDVTRCVTELKKYSRHQHEAVVRQPHPFHKQLGFQEPVLMEWNTCTKLVDSLFDWADAVLYHFVGWKDGWNDLRKPSGFRNSNVYYNALQGRFFCSPWYNAKSTSKFKMVSSSHLGARDFLPGCSFLPVLIPINDPLYTPDWSDRPPCISYAKHSAEIRFSEWNGVKLQNLDNHHHPVLLHQRRTEASVVIDNISDGHYGLAGLEALSQGLPVIVFNHETTKEQLRDLAPEYPPFIEVGPSLEQALNTAAEQTLNTDLRFSARLWIENYYHSARLIEKYWDRFVDRLCA